MPDARGQRRQREARRTRAPRRGARPASRPAPDRAVAPARPPRRGPLPAAPPTRRCRSPATRRRGGRNCPRAGDAPAAVRVVADVPRAGARTPPSRTASACSGGHEDHPLVGVLVHRRRGRARRRPSAPAPRPARRTRPGLAASALVWAVNSAAPARISRWISAPLGVSAATVSTPRSSSGWCASSSPRSAHRRHDVGGGVDRDRDRVDGLVGIAAHQSDRVPAVRQPGRVGRVEHGDDLGESHAHLDTSTTSSTVVREPDRQASGGTGASSGTMGT